MIRSRRISGGCPASDIPNREQSRQAETGRIGGRLRGVIDFPAAVRRFRDWPGARSSIFRHSDRSALRGMPCGGVRPAVEALWARFQAAWLRRQRREGPWTSFGVHNANRLHAHLDGATRRGRAWLPTKRQRYARSGIDLLRWPNYAAGRRLYRARV